MNIRKIFPPLIAIVTALLIYQSYNLYAENEPVEGVVEETAPLAPVEGTVPPAESMEGTVPMPTEGTVPTPVLAPLIPPVAAPLALPAGLEGERPLPPMEEAVPLPPAETANAVEQSRPSRRRLWSVSDG